MASYPYLYHAWHYRRCAFCGEPIEAPEAVFEGSLYHFECLDIMQEDYWKEWDEVEGDDPEEEE